MRDATHPFCRTRRLVTLRVTLYASASSASRVGCAPDGAQRWRGSCTCLSNVMRLEARYRPRLRPGAAEALRPRSMSEPQIFETWAKRELPILGAIRRRIRCQQPHEHLSRMRRRPQTRRPRESLTQATAIVKVDALCNVDHNLRRSQAGEELS
jgi:hypothetical protein